MSTSLLIGLALVVAAPAPKEVPKKDAPTLVGMWVVESGIKGGKQDKASGPGTLELTADGKMVLKENGRDIEGTYTIEGKKDPAEVDLVLAAGGMSVSLLGIFKLEKDTLTLCLVFMGERPKTFASPDGSMTILLTLKRAKKD